MRITTVVRAGAITGLMVALAACGSSGTKTNDGSPDGAEVGSHGGAGGGTDAAAGVTGEAGGGGAGTGADGGATDADGGGTDAADTGAAGTTGAAGGCGLGTPDAGAGVPIGACAVGTAECGGAAGDCETNIATDVMNCGRCGRACGATATCTNGLCAATVILAPDVSSNWCGGAFSATTAYMITCWGTSLSEVRAAPLEPGATVLGTRIKHYTGVPVVALRGILIEGDSVYYGLEASPTNLWKFPLTATGPTDVTSAAVLENAVRFDDLQLVGDTYYWNNNTHTVAGQISPSTIRKRAKTDTATTTLVSGLGLSFDLQVTPTQLLWLEQRTTTSGVSLYRAPLAGAAIADVKKVADTVGGAAMVKRGDYVYWTHKAAAPNGKIRRYKFTDEAAQPEDVASCLNLPEGIVTDASYVYFKQLDALYRVPLAGGAVQQLSPTVPAHDQQATTIFHVDDKYVYFAAGAGFGASTLVRVAK